MRLLTAQRSTFCGQPCTFRRSQRVAHSSVVRPVCMAKQTVLVTGANGRTGRLIYEKLKQREDFVTRGLVRRACSQA